MAIIPSYPNSIVTDEQLKIASNRVFTTLRGSISASDTVITVADPTRIEVNMLLTIDAEVLSVSAINGNNLTVERGFDDTVAAPHSNGRTVAAFWTGWHHNSMSAEVKAIEQALGPNLSNVAQEPSTLLSTKFDFAAQQPGGSLTGGIINQITLSPVPAGVNGTDVGHFLYISGGVGTTEAVLITGGTAVAGAGSGTLIFTPANNHSGAWQIQSASDGIQEAIVTLPATGGVVTVPAGQFVLNANVGWAGKTNSHLHVLSGASFTGVGTLPAQDLANRNTQVYTTVPGAVVMIHGKTNAGGDAGWLVYKPDGSILDVSGTETAGLQEAIDFAWINAYPLIVYGGGITPPTAPIGIPQAAYSQINCNVPIHFRTGWTNSYKFYGVNLYYSVFNGVNPAFTADPNLDFITFGSSDMMHVDLENTQIIYPGDLAAVRFLPDVDNGESFAGITSSTFKLGTIAVVAPLTIAPKTTSGIGIHFSMPDLGLGLPNGDGLIINSTFTVTEINGGLTGINLDDPGLGNTFRENTIIAAAIHGQGSVGIAVGQSGVGGPRIFGNKWKVTIRESGVLGINIWSGDPSSNVGDFFELNISASSNGINLQPSATNNLILSSGINFTGSQVINNATAQTNRFFMSGGPTREDIIAGASPFTLQNKTGRIAFYFVSGANITQVGLSHDGVSFADATGAPLPVNSYYTLIPGMYLQITYTGAAPVIFFFY